MWAQVCAPLKLWVSPLGTDPDIHDYCVDLRLSEAHPMCSWQRSSGRCAVLLLQTSFLSFSSAGFVPTLLIQEELNTTSSWTCVQELPGAGGAQPCVGAGGGTAPATVWVPWALPATSILQSALVLCPLGTLRPKQYCTTDVFDGLW